MTRIVHSSPRPKTASAIKNQTSASERSAEKSDNESKFFHKQASLELVPDYMGEDRHEFVARVAYRLWEERGRPIGSPEVDWFAAEQAVYSSMVASGMIAPATGDNQPVSERIYY